MCGPPGDRAGDAPAARSGASGYERRLDALLTATRQLIAAEQPEVIAERASSAAADILDLRLNVVHLYDESAGELVPVAWSDASEALVGEPPSFGPEDSLAWRTFERGEVAVFDEPAGETEVYNAETPIRSEIQLPLGEHGVFIVGDTAADAFDETDVTLAELLASNVAVALDRAADERELRARERELRRQNEQLDEFASVLSHDLRNPLNVATGRLEMLAEEVDSPHIEPLRRAHERMETLIEDVLTLARQGRSVGETAPVPLAAAATEAWGQVRADGVTFEVETDLTVEADESRLQQLFENLFRNATEHARPDDGAPLTLRVGALDADAGFYVADDGEGIPPAERERVFARGFTTAADGTGFGLTIVRQVALAHGWEITVTESESGGARFEVRTG